MGVEASAGANRVERHPGITAPGRWMNHAGNLGFFNLGRPTRDVVGVVAVLTGSGGPWTAVIRP